MKQKAKSERVFIIATNEPIAASQSEAKSAKNQRAWLLAQIRNEIVADGKQLLTESDEASFSKHGSLYLRLHGQTLNDIDVYVVLNGCGSKWGEVFLEGRGEALKNEATRGLFDPSTSLRTTQWMQTIMKRVVEQHHMSVTFQAGARGAKIAGFGPKKRNYDVIPAFQYRDERGRIFHLIPSGNGWESNPTENDRCLVAQLDSRFARDPDRRLLGYRDLVKLLKFVASQQDWQSTADVTSFMIRHAVADALHEGPPREQKRVSNQATIDRIVRKLNAWRKQGFFLDPYTKQRQPLRRSRPRRFVMGAIFEVILKASS